MSMAANRTCVSEMESVWVRECEAVFPEGRSDRSVEGRGCFSESKSSIRAWKSRDTFVCDDGRGRGEVI